MFSHFIELLDQAGTFWIGSLMVLLILGAIGSEIWLWVSTNRDLDTQAAEQSRSRREKAVKDIVDSVENGIGGLGLLD